MTPPSSARTGARCCDALRGRLPAAELVAYQGDRIAGFMLGRNGRSASQIGPLVAEDDAVAQALLARAIPAIESPIYLDLADIKTKSGPGLRSADLQRSGR